VVRAIATVQMTLSANRDYNHHCTPVIHWAPNQRAAGQQIGRWAERLPNAGSLGLVPAGGGRTAAAGRPRPRLPAPPARGCPPTGLTPDTQAPFWIQAARPPMLWARSMGIDGHGSRLSGAGSDRGRQLDRLVSVPGGYRPCSLGEGPPRPGQSQRAGRPTSRRPASLARGCAHAQQKAVTRRRCAVNRRAKRSMMHRSWSSPSAELMAPSLGRAW
jgi:hypothetical protein